MRQYSGTNVYADNFEFGKWKKKLIGKAYDQRYNMINSVFYNCKHSS